MVEHFIHSLNRCFKTCYARLDTFTRGIWIPSASLSMASFTFKLQHFKVMLSLTFHFWWRPCPNRPQPSSLRHPGKGWQM